MNKAKELYQKIIKRVDNFDWESIRPILLDEMGQATMSNIEGGALYRPFIAELCRLEKPKQFVELGSHSGKTTALILAAMSKDSRVIAVDISDDLRYVCLEDPRLVQVIGNDLNLEIYPKHVNLHETDIWFIDTNHKKEHLAKEFKIYSQFWKPGTIILIDDVFAEHFTLREYWKEIPYDKFRTRKLHEHGFGIVVVS